MIHLNVNPNPASPTLFQVDISKNLPQTNFSIIFPCLNLQYFTYFPSSNAEAKNEWNYNSAPIYAYMMRTVSTLTVVY
jgi:hypothetical protein